MNVLANAVILQSLGYAIIHSLWQMALLWTAYSIITKTIQLSAKTKYFLAATIQIAGFVWFVFTCSFYFIQYNQSYHPTALAITDISNVVVVAYDTNNFRSVLLNVLVFAEKLLPYLSIAYLLVLTILFFQWLKNYSAAQTLKNTGLHKIDVHWKLYIKETAALLGIKSNVKIFLSEKITSPLTIGFLKPIILVPLASINYLSVTQMEAVLLHELAHIKRMDYLLNLLLSIIEIMLFFNPFTKAISKHIQSERENSCDDWVLQFKYNPTTYAEALLKVAVANTPSTITMHAVSNKNSLLQRVRRMTVNQNSFSFNYQKHVAALLFILMAIVSITWLLPKHNKFNHQNNNSVKAVQKTNNIQDDVFVYIKPMAAKISNPLFNPLFFFKQPLQEEINKNIVKTKQDNLKDNLNKTTENTHNDIAAIQTTQANFQQVIEGFVLNNTDSIVMINNAMNTKKIFTVQGNKINFDSTINVWVSKLNQLGNYFNNKNIAQAKYQFKFNKNNMHQMMDSVKLIKVKADSLYWIAKHQKAKLINAHATDDVDVDDDEVNNFPIHYAMNFIQDTTNINTSFSYENEIMILNIKRKKKDNTCNNEEPSAATIAKEYDVIIKNIDQPDKRLIIRIWQ
jgi:beta-lactamase regulating signal transducer with metallopeptidase domain